MAGHAFFFSRNLAKRKWHAQLGLARIAPNKLSVASRIKTKSDYKPGHNVLECMRF
jgi:hypothetical protein